MNDYYLICERTLALELYLLVICSTRKIILLNTLTIYFVSLEMFAISLQGRPFVGTLISDLLRTAKQKLVSSLKRYVHKDSIILNLLFVDTG
jgi:hypothetical protein